VAKLVETEDGQRQAALQRLLIILFNSRDIRERLGALYAFKCYLAENEEGQMALASTLRPPPTADDEASRPLDDLSIGRRLLRSLLDPTGFVRHGSYATAVI
jgi:hypothetical protein